MYALIMLIILADIHKTAIFLKGRGGIFLESRYPRNMLLAVYLPKTWEERARARFPLKIMVLWSAGCISR